MCQWRRWIIPGALCVVGLTALALMFKAGSIEADLTERTTAALARDGLPWASANLDGRNVTLQGTAPSQAARELAYASANRVWGNFRVGETGLALLPHAEPFEISVTETPESITVRGVMPGAVARTRFLDALREGAGLRTIVDETTLASGAPEGLDGFLSFIAARFAGFDTGEATLSGRNLQIQGLASSLSHYHGHMAALERELPEGMVLASQDIRVESVDPYVTAARKVDGGVVLTGYVPSEEARGAFVSAASAFGTADDQLQIAPGAPQTHDATVLAALSAISGLIDGEFSLSGEMLTLSGRATNAETYETATHFVDSNPTDVMSISATILPPVADAFTLTIARTGQDVAISGFVPSELTRSVLVDALVSDHLTVSDTALLAGGAPEGLDLEAIGPLASNILALLDPGTITLADGRFTVTGMAIAMGGRAVAEEAAGSLSLIGASDTDIRITQMTPQEPYAFGAEAMNQAVTLNGNVPTRAVGDELVAFARERFTGGVTDALVVLDGATEGFLDLAKAALQALSRLDHGTASLSDTDVSLTGTAFVEGSLAAIENGLRATAGIGALDSTLSVASGGPQLATAECDLSFARLLGDNSIRFETGSAAIDSTSFGLLDRLAQTVNACGEARIEVSGHTDATGGDVANLALSKARADAVVSYLVNAGIAADRLTAEGYGAADPIAPNDTPEGRARNRRIEFQVIRN